MLYPGDTRGDGSMAHILVIDDDGQVRFLMERWLKKAGHTAAVAADGRAGMRMVSSERPDLVITDLFMPEEDGLEFIRKLQGLRPDLPIIAISGGMSAVSMSFLPVAEKLGAIRTFEKPVNMQELLSAVRELLGERSPGPD
jgi:DNA-binding NtrC family response regulator